MLPRERVLTAIARRPTDRCPADYKAEPQVNEAMLAALKVNSYEELLATLQIDLRRIEPRYIGPPDKIYPNGDVEDYWGIRSRAVQAVYGTYHMFVESALWSAQTVEDLEQHTWPSPDFFDYSVMKEQCRRYPEHAIIYEGSDLFTRPGILRGMENIMVDMALRPEMAHYLFRKFTDFYCQDLTRALEATGGGFQLTCQWSDYGTQQGLLISREMWLEFVAPYLKELIDVAHSGGLTFMTHSCGAIREIIPDLIALGVDVLDPIQVMAKGMEPAGIKRDFGDRLSFHGGVCVQSTLPKGTCQEVRQAARQCVETLGAGGGYILAPSHNVQPDAPVENVLAMYEPALREC